MSLKEILQTTQLEDLNQSRPVVVIRKDASLDQALQVLAHEHVHSVPLFDPETKTYPCFVKAHNILTHILALIVPENPHEPTEEVNLHQLLSELQNLEKVRPVFESKKISDILPSKDDNKRSDFEKIIPVSEKATLWDALLSFSHNIHRLACFNHDGQITRVISQSALLSFLAKHISALPLSLGSISVTKAGLVKKEHHHHHQKEKNAGFVCIDPELPAMNAFWKMFTDGVDCLGIVNEGRLVSHISESDISGITHNSFAHLLLPTKEFLQQYSRRSNQSPVMTNDHATVETVILKMAACQVRRIWIVNNEFRPIGLVTLTDVCKWLSDVLNQE